MTTEAQSAPEMGAESDDVHADVRAAVEALSAKHEDTSPAEDTAPADRARNDRGQFAKAETAQADTVTDTDPIEGKDQPSSPAVEAPTSWSADAKAKWSALDPSIQAEIVRREQNMHEGGQKWSEEKRRYEETISPVREMAQRYGVDERDGLNRLLAANDYLERDPVAAIQWLAQAYGVDLQNPNASQPTRPQADPMLTQLSQEVSRLKSVHEQREQKELQSSIEAFKSAPGHDHFEEVKQTMGQLMLSGAAGDMEEAYQKAIWATPAIREKLLAAQTAKAAEEGKARAQTDKAKRAAISLSGSPASGAAPVTKQDYETVDDAARAAARAHGWAV